MANLFFKSFSVGLQRRWRDGVRNGLAAVGGVWTVTEMTTAALPVAKVFLEVHGGSYLEFILAIFSAGFLFTVKEPLSVSFKIPTTDTSINLQYGDLFEQNANILIGVNEYFDGELGQPVSKSSLHGQLISRNYGGNAGQFRAAVDPQLAAGGFQAVATRTAHPCEAYPIGTTIKVQNGQHSVFLMAMARTNTTTFKATSDVPTLWVALCGGLAEVHAHGNGAPLAMPLFGNGQAGINLKPQHLLRLLTLSLIDFGRNSNTKLPKQVHVILHDQCFEELDIREIARDWKKA